MSLTIMNGDSWHPVGERCCGEHMKEHASERMSTVDSQKPKVVGSGSGSGRK